MRKSTVKKKARPDLCTHIAAHFPSTNGREPTKWELSFSTSLVLGCIAHHFRAIADRHEDGVVTALARSGSRLAHEIRKRIEPATVDAWLPRFTDLYDIVGDILAHTGVGGETDKNATSYYLAFVSSDLIEEATRRVEALRRA